MKLSQIARLKVELMSSALFEPPAPPGPAGRMDIEAALQRHGTALRFVGWDLQDAELAGLDFHAANLWGPAPAVPVFRSVI